MPTTPLSILDLAYVASNATPADALHNALDLAQHAEQWGYKRFWMAEHHNMAGIASAATSVALGYIAAGTNTIRVGAGGVMLPNHSPLVIAEQFGTLASLYPNRIDLGLGRAPGTDGLTLRALRRRANAADNFPQDVLELQAYFGEADPSQKVQAVPGTGLEVPLWILGSSTFGAQLAAHLGLPYAFASHFAPRDLMEAIEIYRRNFQPAQQLAEPYVMVAANITLADTDVQAEYIFSSMQQAYINILTGQRERLPPPVDNINDLWTPQLKAQVASMLSCAIVGSPATAKAKLNAFISDTGADEVIAVSSIYEHAARLRSFELLSRL